jgi:hypothetical protein
MLLSSFGGCQLFFKFLQHEQINNQSATHWQNMAAKFILNCLSVCGEHFLKLKLIFKPLNLCRENINRPNIIGYLQGGKEARSLLASI